MTIEQLHNKYYLLFSELYANRAKLPDKQYALMSSALTQAYESERDLLVDELELETATNKFLLKLKVCNETPKRGGLFRRWNKYARTLRKNYFAEFENTLAQISNETKCIKENTQELNAETTEETTPIETVTTVDAETTLSPPEQVPLLEEKTKR